MTADLRAVPSTPVLYQETSPIRVLVADRQAVFRLALARSLGTGYGIEIVGEAGDWTATARLCAGLAPDVVLLDVALAGRELVSVRIDAIAARGSKVVVVGQPDDHDVLLIAMEAGAHGYTTKELQLSGFARVIQKVHVGELALPRQMTHGLMRRLIDRRFEVAAAAARLEELTRREREVLDLLARGCGTADVANALVISSDTARTHIQNVLGKLDVHSRADAVALALRYRRLLPDAGAVGAFARG